MISVVGAGLGDVRSEIGTSKSIEPTEYGPVYWGNCGVGFNLENQDILKKVVADYFARKPCQ